MRKKYFVLIPIIILLAFAVVRLSIRGVPVKPNPNYNQQKNSLYSNIARNDNENIKMEHHRFVVFADTRGSNNGVNDKTLGRILEEIQRLNPKPEFIAVPGDLVDGSKTVEGLKSQLEHFKQIADSYFSPDIILAGMGNHELVGRGKGLSDEKVFPQVFSEFRPDNLLVDYDKTAYYKDFGNIRLVMLNSSHPGEENRITGKQLEWLKKITQNTSRHSFVFVHAPAYPTGAHVGSSLDSHPADRDKFWEVIDHNNVDMVFCGHEHNYSRRLVDSSFNTKTASFNRKVYQIVAGTAGAPPYRQFSSKKNVIAGPIAEYHFAVVDVVGQDVKVKVVSIDGKIIDEFNITRNKSSK